MHFRTAGSGGKKAALLLFSVAVLLAGGAAAVRGQSALDGFDPNANGMVRVVVVQPDGKILLGGDFTTLSPNGGAPVTRNHIARLNPDGTLDTAFNPNANNTVYSIAVQADGKILVGGDFSAERTASADRRATASPGSIPPPDWLIRSTRTRTVIVDSIAVQADGKILVGGNFFIIGGQARNGIARLDATTGMADSFNPNANAIGVHAITVQADGKILVGGSFHQHRRTDAPAASPGSILRPAWLIHSTRTRTTLSIQSRCRRTARF